MITSADIRAKFLAYFQGHGHALVPSASLLPGNDPTLLFTNAGMVPFKDVFLGTEMRPYKRAVSAQKCMRVSGKHNDLDQVGPSPRHHTFFEMLGNFSFGDYFKREAIDYAWAFVTRELGLDKRRLHITVYEQDDDAYDLWRDIAAVPPERISRLGKQDNFWAMGDTGPCGPDSELFWDRGPEHCTCQRPLCSPATGCDRYMELWNLVFMQFETRADGSVVPLPRPSVDTGMGLERVTSVLQGVDNNYDTDVFLPIMRRTRELLGQSEASMRANLVPYRVIADHSRALAFLIADGVLPGNEGRSYVLRLILRRAARFGKLLGFEAPFLAETAQAVIDTMGHHYTELVERRDFIREAITREEERFLTTLSVGLGRLGEIAQRLKSEGGSIVPGEEVFRLYDTFGFPYELTRDASLEMGLVVDEAGFRAAMQEQRERARSAQRFGLDASGALYRGMELPRTEFLGYDSCRAESRVLAVVVDGRRGERAEAEQQVEVVLQATPFYPESGGQVGDTGELRTADGPAGRLAITDTVRPLPELIVHRGTVTDGSIAVGDRVTAVVEAERRLDIARNHTATHLLHRALRQVLGEHAAQSGSLVAPDRLRFDFTHLAPLTREELRRVEAIVNEQVRANSRVSTEETSFDAARKSGAIALFGEKYGDQVRVVSVPGFTAELCGGTHLDATGQVGLFLIVGESSIGSGLRRIEAVTGRGAETFVRDRLGMLDAIAELVSARPGEELQRVEGLSEQLRGERRANAELQSQLAARDVDSLLGKAREVSGVKLLATRADATNVDALRDMCDRFREKLGSAVVALGALIDQRPMLVVAVTADLVQRGLHAGKIAGAAASKMGGGGGGRPNMAQAGGKDASGLDEAIAAVAALVSAAVK